MLGDLTSLYTSGRVASAIDAASKALLAENLSMELLSLSPWQPCQG